MSDHINRFVGDEFPSIAWTWWEYDPDTDSDVISDVSAGWTGTVRIWHPDRGRTVVLRVGSDVTLAGAVPENHIWTPTAADDTALLTAWGKTLPADGTVFCVEPFLAKIDTPTENRRWDGPIKTMRLFPAQTLPS